MKLEYTSRDTDSCLLVLFYDEEFMSTKMGIIPSKSTFWILLSLLSKSSVPILRHYLKIGVLVVARSA